MHARVSATYRIVRWIDCPQWHDRVPDIETIFFEAAGQRVFADATERSAFRYRWLGQFLSSEPELVHLALSAGGRVVGYLVGCLADPAGCERFSDLSYFGDFASLTRRYPAQLHVNVAAGHRSTGVGADLVESFLAAAASAGAPGVHVVTGRGLRNVGFYNRLEFVERGSTVWRGRDLVLLGRELNSPTAPSPATASDPGG